MKTLICGLALALGVSTNAMAAEQMLRIDGVDYPLATLLQNCQSMGDNPASQIACFNALSQLMEQQGGSAQQETASVAEALEALQEVAQYIDTASGLSITGADCDIQIVYFNNYFHISRRNISTIDLYSAKFDASNFLMDQTVKNQGGPAPLSKGFMDGGATAEVMGGVELDSAQNNFASRSPQMSIDAYAYQVIDQVPAREEQAFNFVLVHPSKSDASADIWNAFESYVTACKE